MVVVSETEPRGGGLSGGPGTSLLFYVIVPGAVLAVAVVVFRFARSSFFCWLAAFAILAPLIALGVHEAQEMTLRHARTATRPATAVGPRGTPS